MTDKIIGYILYGLGFLIMLLFGSFILSYLSEAFRSFKDFGISVVVITIFLFIFRGGIKTFNKGRTIIALSDKANNSYEEIPEYTIFNIFLKLLAVFLIINSGNRLFQLLMYSSKNGIPNDVNLTPSLILTGVNILLSVALLILSNQIKKKYEIKEQLK
ncbi:MAG: hypothetical protein O2963_03480 [Proteobacteria bacterium]|nr:hypothetical protein [Pseudomonadota bacterium]